MTRVTHDRDGDVLYINFRDGHVDRCMDDGNGFVRRYSKGVLVGVTLIGVEDVFRALIARREG